MDSLEEDVKFINDETLDFGFPSPLDGHEVGDSVCCLLERSQNMAQTIDLNVLLGESDGKAKDWASQWSFLAPEKLDEVMKEANLLAVQLEKCQLVEEQNTCSKTKLEMVPEHKLLPPVEYLQEVTESPENSRRKTFNVNNSPMEALLPKVGPITYRAQPSPKALFKGRSPSSPAGNLPSSKRLQNTSDICSADVLRSKTSGPKKVSTKKVTSRSNKTDKPFTQSSAIEVQQRLKHFPQADKKIVRKTEDVSGKDCATQDPQNSSSKSTIPVTRVKGKLGSRLTIPVKKIPAAPEKTTIPLQKTKASQVKTMGSNGLKMQASAKPHSSCSQFQTRHTVTSAPASQLPVPKPTSGTTLLGRHRVPRQSSQLKPLSSETSRVQRSIKPTFVGGRKAACQQPVTSSTIQNSRLQRPKTTTLSELR